MDAPIVPTQTEPTTIMESKPREASRWRRVMRLGTGWIDSTRTAEQVRDYTLVRKVARLLPYILMHAGCLLVIFVGWSWTALAVCAVMYALRMFAITGFYHRYFSHRTFKTTRPMQFIFGVLGCSAVQRGPLWWAAHHREHHRHSDDEHDLHSPRQHGFLWAHMLWFLSPDNTPTNVKAVPDLIKFPELRWIDRYDGVVPAALATLTFAIGWGIAKLWPDSGTSGLQVLAWGFFISTIICYHATYTINSLSHVWGRKRFQTGDDSRNNFVLAILTFGEGWHNNHHHFPGSVRQGFYWWEIDLTYYTLWALSKIGIVWDLNPVPKRVYGQTMTAR
jgi:stearoyl-CoA desaturase (delta-9 desaturase)